ncbi:hypothetical protein [Streptomyces mirabilis]|uniref:hypothetical protein n=1 Tax=Streptomyces mirabilis TaxID=68239 RepID=UPI0032457D97
MTAGVPLAWSFAEMDPADAIRLAADARPDAAPADLAHLLGTYGVPVDAVAAQEPKSRRVRPVRNPRYETPFSWPPLPGEWI